MAKKPKGFGAFHKLAKRLVAIPKEKVDQRIAEKREDSTRNPPKK